MLWTQVASIIYICLLLGFCIRHHVALALRGHMGWEAIEWKHVTEGIRGATPGRLALFRIGFAVFNFATTGILLTKPFKWPVGHKGHLSSAVIFGTFTVWSWTLIGIYAIVSGLASAAAALGFSGSRPWCRALAFWQWMLFQVMFAAAILVFFVVWLVLIPQMYAVLGNDGGLLWWGNLAMHNLNVAFMALDMIFNRLTFATSHFVFVLYYCILYVVFSWFFALKTGIFFYFFIDWRQAVVLPGYTLVLIAIGAAFWAAQRLTQRAKRGLAVDLPGPVGAARDVGLVSG